MSKFTLDECKLIEELAINFEKVHSYAVLEIGGKPVKKLHDFYHRKIIRSKETQWIFDRFKVYLQSTYPNNKIELKKDITFNVFPEGCNLDKHIDSENQAEVVHICGVKLNSNYTGGEFVLYVPEEVLDFPVGIIYDLDVKKRVHEIKKVTSGERTALVLFLSLEDLGLKASLI